MALFLVELSPVNDVEPCARLEVGIDGHAISTAKLKVSCFTVAFLSGDQPGTWLSSLSQMLQECAATGFTDVVPSDAQRSYHVGASSPHSATLAKLG